MFDAIPRVVLSPQGWQCLMERVTVDGLANGTVIAADDEGRHIDYDDVAGRAIAHRMADVWLWGVPLVVYP